MVYYIELQDRKRYWVAGLFDRDVVCDFWSPGSLDKDVALGAVFTGKEDDASSLIRGNFRQSFIGR